MKDDWNDYQFFLSIAENGTLKAAANTLKVNISTVLRRVNALEEKMGARLFERTHDGFSLTQSGEIMKQHALSMQEHAHKVVRRVKDSDKDQEGLIRLSVSDSVFQSFLAPFIQGFRKDNPDIYFEFIVSHYNSDLAKREADIAMSVGNVRPDYMIGRSLMPIQYRFYGLKKNYPKPFDSEKELIEHPILGLDQSFDHQPFVRWIRENISDLDFTDIADQFSTMHKMIEMGLGIGLLPNYYGDNYENFTALWTLPENANKELWILMHPDLRNVVRVKKFMEAARLYFSN